MSVELLTAFCSHMPAPSIPPLFSHTCMRTCLTVHRLIQSSVVFVFKSLQFYSGRWESSDVPERPGGEWHLYCWQVLCLSLAPNADELSLWGSGRQPGLLAEEKSIRPSIASKEPLSSLPLCRPEPPTSHISLLSYLLLVNHKYLMDWCFWIYLD